MALIYNGPMTKTLSILRRVSAATLGLSITSSILISIFDNSPLVVSTLGIAIVTSSLSTGLIHYCISPYVTDIYNNSGSLEIGSLSLCGNRIATRVCPSEIIPIHGKPFTNWAINGDSQTLHPWNLAVRRRLKFYVHTNLEDLHPDMKSLIDQVAQSEQGSSLKTVPIEDWDSKIAELKKKN